MSRRHTERILSGGFNNSPPRSRRRVVAKTANYICVDKDSGTVFTTEGAGGSITFTLPAVTLTGWWATFVNLAAQNMTISSAEGGNIVGRDSVGAAEDLTLNTITFGTSPHRTGNGLTLVSTGTRWVVLMSLFAREATITTQVPATTT